jgi:hypothetical protein
VGHFLIIIIRIFNTVKYLIGQIGGVANLDRAVGCGISEHFGVAP